MPPDGQYPIFMQCDPCRGTTKHMLRFDPVTGQAKELECSICGNVVGAERESYAGGAR
jgi:hypothetical protein